MKVGVKKWKPLFVWFSGQQFFSLNLQEGPCLFKNDNSYFLTTTYHWNILPFSLFHFIRIVTSHRPLIWAEHCLKYLNKIYSTLLTLETSNGSCKWPKVSRESPYLVSYWKNQLQHFQAFPESLETVKLKSCFVQCSVSS